MATSVGTITFLGRSGQTYIKDLFIVDTANALNRWDSGAGASSTSPDYWQTPEDVTMVSYNQVAATGQTRTAINVNSVPTGDMIRNSQHIPSATIINLPYIGKRFPGGVKISLTAIA